MLVSEIVVVAGMGGTWKMGSHARMVVVAKEHQNPKNEQKMLVFRVERLVG